MVQQAVAQALEAILGPAGRRRRSHCPPLSLKRLELR
jgi:hypothetical protein